MPKQIELTEEQLNLICKIPLFRDTTDTLRNYLLDDLDMTAYSIEKGEIIIHQGSPCRHLNILLKGRLDVNIIDASGNNVKIEYLNAPRAFGTPHLFDEANVYPATFTVVENGIWVRASKKNVFELISSHPQLLKNFLRITGNCNCCTVSRLKILSYKSIKSRFVNYLFEHKISDSFAEMQHNQTQLAEYIGVSRPALAAEISKLEKERLIAVDGKTVQLLNINQLLKLI